MSQGFGLRIMGSHPATTIKDGPSTPPLGPVSLFLFASSPELHRYALTIGGPGRVDWHCLGLALFHSLSRYQGQTLMRTGAF